MCHKIVTPTKCKRKVTIWLQMVADGQSVTSSRMKKFSLKNPLASHAYPQYKNHNLKIKPKKQSRDHKNKRKNKSVALR